MYKYNLTPFRLLMCSCRIQFLSIKSHFFKFCFFLLLFSILAEKRVEFELYSIQLVCYICSQLCCYRPDEQRYLSYRCVHVFWVTPIGAEASFNSRFVATDVCSLGHLSSWYIHYSTYKILCCELSDFCTSYFLILCVCLWVCGDRKKNSVFYLLTYR